MQAEAREPDQSGAPAAEIATLDRQIADVIETLVAVGKPEGLTAKLRELEQRKRVLGRQSAVVPQLVNGAAAQWREIVSNLERLADYSTPDELETARTLLADYIGEVSVVERPGRRRRLREAQRRRGV